MSRIILLLTLVVSSLLTLVILPQETSAATRVIFEDNFDDGNYDGWNIVRNTCKYNGQPAQWKVINKKVGMSTNSIKQCFSELVPDDVLWNTTSNDYIVEFDMTLVNGTDHMIAYRYENPSHWYDFHIISPNRLSVSDNVHYGDYTNGQNIHFKLIVQDRTVKIYRDNNLIIDDSQLFEDYQTGKFALMLYAGEDPIAETFYDNIVVTEITDDPLLDVPLLMQVNQDWSNDPYDHINSTIGLSGCAMTSTAMILQYYGINVLPDGSIMNPGTLNNWLINHKGYQRNGSIIWTAISDITSSTKYPELRFLNPDYNYNGLEHDLNWTANDERIEDDLANNLPVILNVNNGGHFVVATGIEDNTFLINDPLYSSPKKLTDNYNGQYQSLRRYVPSETDLSYIVLAIEDNIEVTVKDENGNEIGVQQLEQPVKNTNDTLEFVSYPLKTIYIQKPESGEYIITLTSPHVDTYLLDIYTYDTESYLKTENVEGIIDSSNNDVITINFDKENAENNLITKQVSFQSTIIDVEEAIEMNLINKGIGSAIISQLKNVEKNLNKGKSFVGKIHISVIEKLLEATRSKKILIDEKAYQILTYDIEKLKKIL